MMNVFRSLAEARENGQIRTLALGFFDGVHRGHQRVINAAISGEFSVSGCVLTFQQHPQSVVNPARAPKLLTGWPHKLQDLAELGANNVLALPFDRQMALTTAEQFLLDLEQAFPQLKKISAGVNWRFGHNRSGDIAMLQAWCARQGIELAVSGFVEHHGLPINSSRIRDCVANGELAGAEELLGKPWSLFGTVVKGRQLGRQLSFPTANLATEDQCLPPLGVYFGEVIVSGEIHPAAINIGIKPSVGQDSTEPSVEAHLLNFNRDIYGAQIHVRPRQFHRLEQKFASLGALEEQLHKDIAATLDFILAANNEPADILINDINNFNLPYRKFGLFKWYVGLHFIISGSSVFLPIAGQCAGFLAGSQNFFRH